MPKTVPALTLPDRQTRMINATEGFRLEVLSGCLWLTRPSDSVDRFLVAGDSLELHEAQVLIQSDRRAGQPTRLAATYRLEPLLCPAPVPSAESSGPVLGKGNKFSLTRNGRKALGNPVLLGL